LLVAAKPVASVLISYIVKDPGCCIYCQRREFKGVRIKSQAVAASKTGGIFKIQQVLALGAGIEFHLDWR
jgi:hypothetical protein